MLQSQKINDNKLHLNLQTFAEGDPTPPATITMDVFNAKIKEMQDTYDLKITELTNKFLAQPTVTTPPTATAPVTVPPTATAPVTVPPTATAPETTPEVIPESIKKIMDDQKKMMDYISSVQNSSINSKKELIKTKYGLDDTVLAEIKDEATLAILEKSLAVVETAKATEFEKNLPKYLEAKGKQMVDLNTMNTKSPIDADKFTKMMKDFL